jgi:cytochrome c oxidase cbb3-type subunit 4
MDINDLRSLFTVLAFATFIGIVWWAYSDRRKTAYEEAASLVLDDDSELIPQATRTNERKSS